MNVIQNSFTGTYPLKRQRNIEASEYATRSKIHLVYSWLLVHCLNLSDKHKAQILNELEKRNVQFLEAKKEAEKLGKSSHLLQYDETDELEAIENNFAVCSLPGRFGKIVIEYEINKAFEGDLRGVPGFYFKGGIFRLNVPDWKDGLVKPYFDNEKIIGLYLYRSITDGLPKLFSSHDLLLGKRFIEPVQTNKELFIF